MFSFKEERWGRILSVLVFVVLLSYACGGGGGGGGATPTANARNSAAVMKASTAMFGAESEGAQQKPSGALHGSTGSRAGLAHRSLAILKEQITPSGSFKARRKGEESCLSGERTETHPDEPTVNTVTIITYNDCVLSRNTIGGKTIETYKDGVEKDTFNGATVSVEFTNFREGTRDGTDPNHKIRVSDETTNGTFVLSNFSNEDCGEEVFFPTGTLTVNATLATFEDQNGDGIPERNQEAILTDFKETLAEEFDPNSCIETKTTEVANGQIELKDGVNPSDNFTATFKDFNVVSKLATHGETSGTEVTLNGNITLASNCESGSFDVTTETPLFFPDSAEGDCPTEGIVLVRSGGATTAVTFQGDGAKIDEGNDGTIEQTFPDCSSARICA
jgi:hypothetical protein